MRHRLRLAVAILAGLAALAAAPPPIELVSNRSIYEVSLANSLPGGMVAVRGRTVIEFRDTCDGWETTQRFLADMTDAEGNVSRSDFVIAAWESKTGKSLRFDITNMVDGQLVERHKGTATRNEDGSGEVTLSAPEEQHFPLPAGTMFPMQQTVEVLQAAEAGKGSLTGPVFQGGDETDLYFSASSIGKRVQEDNPSHDRPDGAADLLSGVAAWPVLMSYFPNSEEGVMPEYEVTSHLYANGIIGSMSLIYARFTLKAKLTRVERLASHC